MSNDHIALPDSTLKRFGVSGRISYLDLADNKIKDDMAKYYNASTDYYPKETEDLLNKKVETAMGRLIRPFDRLANGDIDSLPQNPDQLKEWVCQCWVIQWLRTDKSKYIVHSKSKSAKVCNLDATYYDILRRGHIPDTNKGFLQEVFEKNIANNLNDKVERLKRVMINASQNKVCIPVIIDKQACSSSFLLPTTHFVGSTDKLFFIISPFYALALMPITELKRKAVTYRTNQDIDNLTPYSILTEQLYGNGQLVGLKEQLKKAQTSALLSPQFGHMMK